MEFVILGLLMLKPMTGYQIRRFIKNYLYLICSDSAGSMHYALQKMLQTGSIQYAEFVEKGKNKKLYSITTKGENEFQGWVQYPMQTEKVKNMELSKLFFLGFAPQRERRATIKGYIMQLEKMKVTLIALKEEFERIKNSALLETNKQSAEDIFRYQGYTLEYGIASLRFEITWYSNLLERTEI